MSPESQESPAVSPEDLARLGLLEPYVRANLLALAASDVALSDEQIDAARQAFCRQHQIRDGGLARELYLRIDDSDANFADLAARYAEGPEQATRGIVGPVPLTQAHPALVDRLRTAPPGVVLEPFQIESWWLVVRLESLTSATFDEATAARMAQELFEQWISEQVERRLADLRPLLESRVSADAGQNASPGSS